MRPVRWGAVLGVLVVVWTGAGSWAATNPFTGTALERPGVSEAPRTGVLLGIGRSLLLLQRTLNRAIGRHLRAIRDGDSPGALVAGLAFAFLYGVLHTLGPGHGKVVVASYFVSREARLGRGLLMGVQIACTHVLSAVLLLWVTDLSVQMVLGDSAGAVRGVQLLSYGATTLVGAFLLLRAIRRSKGDAAERQEEACAHGHDGATLGLVSLCVGLLPCTGASLIMLFALANHMVVIGTALVGAIAAGMAVTMAALGGLAILTRGAIVARSHAGHTHRAVARTLEVAGALTILLVSAALFFGSW